MLRRCGKWVGVIWCFGESRRSPFAHSHMFGPLWKNTPPPPKTATRNFPREHPFQTLLDGIRGGFLDQHDQPAAPIPTQIDDGVKPRLQTCLATWFRAPSHRECPKSQDWHGPPRTFADGHGPPWNLVGDAYPAGCRLPRCRATASQATASQTLRRAGWQSLAARRKRRKMPERRRPGRSRLRGSPFLPRPWRCSAGLRPECRRWSGRRRVPATR
jgi:hypothetical protein